MKIKKVKDKALKFCEEMLEGPIKIVGINKVEENENDSNEWEVTIETVEEGKYARQFARDEVIGLYKMTLDKKLEIKSWGRSGFRKRGTLNLGDEEN